MRFTKENTPILIFGIPALAFILYIAGGVALMGSGEANQDGNSTPRNPTPAPTESSGTEGFGVALTPTVAAAILDQARRDAQAAESAESGQVPLETENRVEVAPRKVTHTIKNKETLYGLVPLLVNSNGLQLPVKVSVGLNTVILADVSNASLQKLFSDYRVGDKLIIESVASSAQSEQSVVVPNVQPAAGQSGQQESGTQGQPAITSRTETGAVVEVDSSWVWVEMNSYPGATLKVSKRLLRKKFSDGSVVFTKGIGSSEISQQDYDIVVKGE